MAPPRPLSCALAGLFAAVALAQSDGNSYDNVRVLAAVAYVNHGEKTPWLTSLQKVLTPTGAQQLWRQGAAFRERYLNATSDSAGSTKIFELDENVIDNTQVIAITGDDEWVVSGATAFMQGLYPPATDSFNVLAGGDALAEDFSSNNTGLLNYPLNGYQYPRIETFSQQNSESPR
jgi:hypothetical protein